ncbi:MAG: sigma-70 family RNA polymerase sigma factor [Acidobacteria bacterium]|nr:MAG: sigma-70 family RNA polymerase sigma factor [Acidobacteriota bacterium]
MRGFEISARRGREQASVGAALKLSLWQQAFVSGRPEEAHADDAALVEAARAGDRSAFDSLYQRHARIVHGVLLARVDAADADDLVQEVFLQAWRRLDSLRDPAAFVAWILTVARRRAADHYRRGVTTEELPEEISAEDAPRAEAAAALAAIRALPEAYRETLILRMVEGMSGPEIAARTNLTPASVRVNLHRGMKLLREKLGGTKARE